MSLPAGSPSPAPISAFGHLLKRLRLGAGLTQEELAERAAVSARLVSDLERGVIRRPRRDTVRLLADGLGLAAGDRDAFVALARGPSPVGALAAPAAAPVSSLPRPPAPIVGRAAEIARGAALLRRPEVRLLTLTGPGGVGKTRLALAIAAEALAAFPDGAWFVDVAPVADPHLVPATIAQALAIAVGPGQSPAAALAAAIRQKRLLLVLDNLEHLPDAAPAIAELLTACPAPTILATSRRPLRIRWEREFPVAPLALPDLGAIPPPAELAAVPAVALFVQRAAATGAFALTAENARAVAEIAVRLDGLPLAIELAAARVRLLPPAALLDRLAPRLPLLTGGAQDLPPRQRTMRDAIAWSHDLLAPEHRRLFRRLAVFAGGFGLGAAEAVAGEATAAPFDVVEGLAALVDLGLLRAGDDAAGEARFALLETVREFAGEALAAAGEGEETRRRHAAWCLRLAERAGAELAGPEQGHWFARLDLELDNLRAALAWALERDDAETALRLATAVQRLWTTRGLLGEGRSWLERALATAAAVPPAVRAEALVVAARIAYFQGDYGAVATLGSEALALARAAGDQTAIGAALCTLGDAAEAAGAMGRAEALFEEALARFRRAGDQARVAATLNDLGLLAWRRGELGSAAERHEEAVALRRELGDRVGLARSLSNLGLVAADQGDHRRAAALTAESVGLAAALGSKQVLVDGLEHLGLIAAATGEDRRAARLCGAAAAQREAIGASLLPTDRAYNAPRIAALRTRLGDAAFAAAWEAGRALPLEGAIAVALGDDQPGGRAAGHPPG